MESVQAPPSNWAVDPRAPGVSELPTFSRRKEAPPGTESLDFDVHEHLQFRNFHLEQAEAQRRHCCLRWLSPGTIRWLVIIVAGIGTALIALVIDEAVAHLFKLRLEFVRLVSGAGLTAQFFIFLLVSLVQAALAGVAVCYVEPLAAGSGIPEIKCYLNGVHLPRVLAPRTLLAKVVGIIFAVGSSLPVGKEGPMIHSGAVVGGLVSQAFAARVLRPDSPDKERRDLVAAGAAAGVAAAFSAPVGGVLFAVEEGATHMSSSIMVRTFVCSCLAAFMLRFFSSGLDDKMWGRLGYDQASPYFGDLIMLRYNVLELLIFIGMGVAGGLLGALFNMLNLRLAAWRRHLGPRGTRKYVEVLIVATIIISMNWFAVFFSAGDSAEEILDHNAARLRWKGQGEAIKELFHGNEHFDGRMLAAFGFLQLFTTCWTFGIGVPSGLFLPSLLTGAYLGRMVGQWVCEAEMGSYFHHPNNPGQYAMIGAAAMLSGVARITISASVILMEATSNQTFAIPLFLTTLAAKWVGDIFNQGIYDEHIELRHVPILEEAAPKEFLALEAKDLMAKEVVIFKTVEKVGALLAVLEECTHNGFPVVEATGAETGAYVGLIQRQSLLRVLAHGRDHGLFQVAEEGQLATPAPVLPFAAHSSKQDHQATLSHVRQTLQAEEMERLVDLRPFANPGSYTAPEHSSAFRCHALFRTMGLRHLPVVNGKRRVLGMITRKDLILVEEQKRKVTDDSVSEDQEADEGSTSKRAEVQ